MEFISPPPNALPLITATNIEIHLQSIATDSPRYWNLEECTGSNEFFRR